MPYRPMFLPAPAGTTTSRACGPHPLTSSSSSAAPLPRPEPVALGATAAAGRLKTAYLTTNDPLYLPVFFDRILRERHAETLAVYVTPPLFKKQTTWQATQRYIRTFGTVAAAHLTARVVQAKLGGRSVAAICRKWNVPSAIVTDVNAPEFLAELRGLAPDVLVSVSCPLIFKKPLIELPPRGILNIHGAILPQYRGVMPAFRMLANGEKQAGVSIYFVNEDIDAGDLCGQRVFDIPPDDTLDTFLRRSKAVAADLLVEVLSRMSEGTLTRAPLNLAAGSYYKWPDAAAVSQFRKQGRKLW